MAAERRILTFAPPRWYDLLVLGCFGSALLCWTEGLLPDFWRRWLPSLTAQTSAYWILLGSALAFAGLWALQSNERLVCDLRRGTYQRFEGWRRTRGTLAELDCLVMLAEIHPVLGTSQAIFRLVLFWKGMRHPLLVVETHPRPIAPGLPLQTYAQDVGSRGVGYAQLLGVRFVDGASAPTPAPVPVL